MISKIWWIIFRIPPVKVFVISIISASVLGMAHLFQKENPTCPDLKMQLANDMNTLVSPAWVAAYYAKNSYSLNWVSTEGKIEPFAWTMINTINNAWQEGLEPSAYHAREIRSLCDSIAKNTNSIKALIELDIMLTDAFFSYTSDLYAGRLNNHHWNPGRKEHLMQINLSDSLITVKNGNALSAMLASFSCPHQPYKRLRTLLNKYHLNADTANINKVILNMERWRWLPRNMPDKYIMANTAGFDLHVSHDNKDTLSMKMIVGKQQQPTPIFNSSVQYLIINPWWEIPHSIATKEMLPLIKKDPSYFTDHHIKVYMASQMKSHEVTPNSIDWNVLSENNFPYKLRQTPGPWNALGTIKFIFPNPYQVYFHDTPTPELFKQNERTFSHGCMRIEKPVALAAYLLQQNEESIKKRISTKKEQLFKVAPIQVFVCYWTVYTDPNGTPLFAQDVYGYDLKLQRLIDASRKQTKDAAIHSAEMLQ